MHIMFADNDAEAVVEHLKSVMGNRELAKIVSFDLEDDNLIVTIAKIGKTILTFSVQLTPDGLSCELVNEKVAFSHKALKKEVTRKIIKVIEKAGGIVNEA